MYNIEDRLSEVWEDKKLVAKYYYDPFGRRLWKEVAGVKTYFHYADEGLVGEYDAKGKEIRAFGYAPGSTWTTDPAFVKTDGKYYFYHNDHLGTPQKVTDKRGTVAWAAVYDTFGKASVAEGATVENPLRFAGQYYDAETGLHYNFHRYYDPGVGRYVTVDPIGLAGGINLYTYVLNNPTNWYDPLGLLCKIEEGDKFVKMSEKPMSTRTEVTEDGYWNAMGRYIAWQLAKLRFPRKFPVPDLPKDTFQYIEITTTYGKFVEYIRYYWVCYDECGKETKREPMGDGKTGKTQEHVIREQKEIKYIVTVN